MEITKSSENQENSIVIQDRRECLLEHHYKSLKNIPMNIVKFNMKRNYLLTGINITKKRSTFDRFNQITA